MRVRIAAFLLLLCSSLAPAQSPPDPAATADRVRQEFLHAWTAYKQQAWGHDELKPLSHSFRDWHSASLLMTPVDALDTMYLMGLTDEADRTREYIATHLSFDRDIYVKNFEITIRLLGGLLSAYQRTNDPRLLKLADDLGARLLHAFDSPTGMPYMYVNLKTGAVRGNISNPAEIGTLLLEFGTLSKLTHKPVYYDKAKRALVELYKRRSKLGLVGSEINIETGAWKDTTSHISGGIDSYYEYLLKCARLFGDKDCEKMWKESVAAVNRYLADPRPTGLWYAQVDMNTGMRKSTEFGSLDAFFPAVLALSGDLNRARKLEDSAFKMWNLTGIEPEEIDYSILARGCPTLPAKQEGGQCAITSPKYHLRPEIIESAYYLYFFTHDERYREMGRTFLDSLVRYCRTDDAYAALSDVRTKEKADEMESFFLAETLKYLYLLFAPRDTLDLNNVVFNTEAHPLRRTW